MSELNPKVPEVYQLSFNDFEPFDDELDINEDILNGDMEDYILLENGNVYTYLYHKSSRDHMKCKVEELVVSNFDIRNAILPEEINMCCGLITHDFDFGKDFCSEICLPQNIHKSIVIENDYKDLQIKIQDLLERSRNENPSILIIDEIKNMKLLPMIAMLAKEYNIAIIITMAISDKLNELINECHENEIPVMEIIAAGIWANDKLFNKLSHTFNVSEAVLLTVPYRDGFANRLLIL